MKTVKIVGGELNGMVYSISPTLRFGDVVKIYNNTTSKKAADFEPELISEPVSTKYILYKLEIIKFSDEDNIEFLIPYEWTISQAYQISIAVKCQ